MVYFESEITTRFSCNMHFKNFPDVKVKNFTTERICCVFKQLKVYVHRVNLYFLFKVCSIKIESFAYDTENLGFKWHSPGVEFSNVIEIPQFKLEGKKNP